MAIAKSNSGYQGIRSSVNNVLNQRQVSTKQKPVQQTQKTKPVVRNTRPVMSGKSQPAAGAVAGTSGGSNPNVAKKTTTKGMVGTKRPF